jgi:hypothetical protein
VQSHVDTHDIHFIEGLRAGWAFSHAVCEPTFNTGETEKVPASLEYRVLELGMADSAESKFL